MESTITLNVGSNVGRTNEVMAHDRAAVGFWVSLENHKKALRSMGAIVTRYQNVNVYNYDRESDYEDEYTTVIRITLSSKGAPDQDSLNLVAHCFAAIVSSISAESLGQESIAWSVADESGPVTEGLAWGPNVEPAYEFNYDYFLSFSEAQKKSLGRIDKVS
jgi:hypothetical protein